MKDFFVDTGKRRGIAFTPFLIACIIVAIVASTVTYFFIPTTTVDLDAIATPSPTATPDSSGNEKKDFVNLYNDTVSSVVIIDSFYYSDEKLVHLSQASGFIISEDGYILTNAHCLDGVDVIKVTLYDETYYEAQIIGSDERTEIGVLKINSNVKFQAAVLGDSDLVQVGEYVYAIGHPKGYQFSFSAGYISGIQRVIDSGNNRYQMIQTDTALNNGNSGGPLFNVKGEVIAVNTMKTTSAEGLGFAIPINVAKNIAKQLVDNGKVSRAAIHAYVKNSYDDLGENNGVYIAEVEKDGSADKAGILAEDILVEFNGSKIYKVNDLFEQIEKVEKGQEISVVIIRDGNEMQLKLVLGET